MSNVIRLKEQVRRKSCHAERKFANITSEGFSEIFTKNFPDNNVVYLLITFNQYPATQVLYLNQNQRMTMQYEHLKHKILISSGGQVGQQKDIL